MLRRITVQDISRRLDALRRDSETGMLDTTQIGPIDYLISEEDKEKEIPNDKEFIEAFKDEIEKKEREKIAEQRRFYRTKKSEEIKEREEELKQKMKKIKKSSTMKMLFPRTKKPLGQEWHKETKSLRVFKLRSRKEKLSCLFEKESARSSKKMA